MSKHDIIMRSGEGDRFARYLLQIDEKPWYIPTKTREFLIARADYTCAICGRKGDFGAFHIDHILPVDRGGTCLLENLQVLCRTCNLQKSNHVLDPRSYTLGYVRSYSMASEREIANRILEAVERSET